MSKTPLLFKKREKRADQPFIIKKFSMKRSSSKKTSVFRTTVYKETEAIKNRRQPLRNTIYCEPKRSKSKVSSPLILKSQNSPDFRYFADKSEERKKTERNHVMTINTVYAKTERYCLREVIKNCGWKETNSEGDLLWFVNSLREIDAKMIRYKSCMFNRYPKANVICRKRQFSILMRRYQRYFPYEFDFIPQTIILPEEYKAFKKAISNKIMIAKPSRGKGGEGIFLVKNFQDVRRDSMRTFEYILQDYISNPLLIDGKKFDFRMYLMITGVDVMSAFLASEGMVRICTEDYTPPKYSNKPLFMQEDNLMAHLTNYTLNKNSEKFKLDEDFQENYEGNKRLLSKVFHTLREMGVDIEDLKDDLRDLSTKIVLALQPFLVNSFHIDMGTGKESNQNCFHIFGIDIMLDEEHKPWLLEINCFPSFSIFQDMTQVDPTDGLETKVRKVSEFDKYLKTLLVQEAIEICKDKCIPENSVYEQVFPPREFVDDYRDLTVFNDARIIFEILAGYKQPDFLSLSQFQKLAYFPKMQTETLNKTSYTLIFKQFARKANRSLMSLDNFHAALEHIGREMSPSHYSRLQAFTKVVKLLLAQVTS